MNPEDMAAALERVRVIAFDTSGSWLVSRYEVRVALDPNYTEPEPDPVPLNWLNVSGDKP